MYINDIAITSLDAISAYHLTSGAYLFTLDELQNAKIANTQEKTDITGKGGRKLNSLKKNKAVVVSGTSGLVSGGLLEMQTGSEFEQKDTEVKWTDVLSISDNTATTEFVAYSATSGAEIEYIRVKNANGVVTDELTQGATASEGVFTYDPDTKVITFATGAYADGTEIDVIYTRRINANVLTNVSDTYSEKCRLYIDAEGEDKCGKTYHIQFYIPKADFSGNFDFEMGDNQSVHAFEAESLAGACGTGGALWTYTIFGLDATDVADEDTGDDEGNA